jgi:uncharacterized Zn-binding protein involved in type VI secretion
MFFANNKRSNAMEHNYTEYEFTEEELQLLQAESKRLAARPIKAEYVLATLGSKTRMGGEVVTVNKAVKVDIHPIACVGDIIRYPDGTETKIISGAGYASVIGDKPAAIVGSVAENGDVIISSLQDAMKFGEYADGDGIPGLLQPGYVPPPPMTLEEILAEDRKTLDRLKQEQRA